jgi:hypothetical protein
MEYTAVQVSSSADMGRAYSNKSPTNMGKNSSPLYLLLPRLSGSLRISQKLPESHDR